MRRHFGRTCAAEVSFDYMNGGWALRHCTLATRHFPSTHSYSRRQTAEGIFHSFHFPEMSALWLRRLGKTYF